MRLLIAALFVLGAAASFPEVEDSFAHATQAPELEDKLQGMQDVLSPQELIALPDFLNKFHILPIRGENGKLKWNYDSADPRAKQAWIGNPGEPATLTFDFKKLGLEKFGISAENINKFVRRIGEPANALVPAAPESQEPAPVSAVAAPPAQPDVQSLAQTSPQNQANPIKLDFFSDLSGAKLTVGHWFHRWGDNFDVTDDEWKRLAQADRVQFTRVNTIEDALRIQHESIIANVESQRVRPPQMNVQSDISNVQLEYGKWYHKAGEAFDVSDVEYEKMPQEEKQKFILIQSYQDFARVQADYQQLAHQAPAVLPAAPATQQTQPQPQVQQQAQPQQPQPQAQQQPLQQQQQQQQQPAPQAALSVPVPQPKPEQLAQPIAVEPTTMQAAPVVANVVPPAPVAPIVPEPQAAQVTPEAPKADAPAPKSEQVTEPTAPVVEAAPNWSPEVLKRKAADTPKAVREMERLIETEPELTLPPTVSENALTSHKRAPRGRLFKST